MVVAGRRLRTVFFGSPDFAVPALVALARASDVVAVVCPPDRPSGRGMRLAPPPVAVAARALGLEPFQPERAGDPESLDRLAALAPDLGVVAAFGELFRTPLLALPRLGMFNLHASVLPRWRGASPIQAAIRAGDESTGVSMFRLVRRMDAGPVLLDLETQIGPAETAGELHDRLASLAASTVAIGIARLTAEGAEARLVEQDPAQVTTCGLIAKADGRIDWSGDARAIACHVRAMTPWPGAQTATQDRAGRRLELVVAQAAAVPGAGEPGRRVIVAGESLVVACGRGAVALRRVKAAGRREMGAAELLRGIDVADDAAFV